MVGEIQDEDDALSAALESGVALVRGDLTVIDLTEGLGMPPYSGKGHITVGELVESLLGKQACKGDTVRFKGLRMTVEEMLEGNIWMVRLDRSGK
jgi:CBS domain containing-hemolysin-like protein